MEANLSPTKHDVLTDLSFGAQVAEDEREGLAEYFVETDQWRKVASGAVDVVFGPKGSGKSAIYFSLMDRESDLFDRDIILVSADRPRGTSVFSGITSEPPTSELEFVGVWKLYVLTLLGSVVVDYDLQGDAATRLRAALYEEGLLKGGDAPLASRFKAVWDWVKSTFKRTQGSGELSMDPVSQIPIGLAVKISINEPSAEDHKRGFRSLDELLGLADRALEDNDLSVWILFDRLDAAFIDSRELEANGIRALFKAYLDMRSHDRIGLKVFLRSDIWNEVTASGFREASHITRQISIEWGGASLLNLVSRRALRVKALTDYYGVDEEAVLSAAETQREFFDRLVPEKVDVGKNPKTFDWILGRVQDGTKKSAPREVIHLLNAARDAQIKMLERGEPEPPGENILSRAALKESLEPVSNGRLYQTLFAEYPTEKEWILELDGGKAEHTAESLAGIWEIDISEVAKRVQRLVEIGFWEQRNHGTAPTYWVPFLYRPALHMKQGAAQ